MGPSKRRFDEIFETGRRVQGKLCRISSLPGEGKVGIATAKKIGNRPQRHAVRRRIQAALREIDFRPNRPLDLIVIATTAAAGVGTREIAEELTGLLRKTQERWADELECS
jgi:ribonuclease P protein component